MMGEKKPVQATVRMPLLALRGLVLFPKMVLHFDIGRDKSVLALNEVLSGNRRIFLVAQKDLRTDSPDASELYTVGVVAEVKQMIRTNSEGLRVMVEGLYRAKTVKIVTDDPFFMADVRPLPVKELKLDDQDMASALIRAIKDQFEQYTQLSPKMPREILINVMSEEDPSHLVEYIAGNIPLSVEEKQEVLTQSNPIKRLELLTNILESENGILGLEHDIYEKVKEQIDKNQREYYLREQLKVISTELGDSDGVQEEVFDYIDRIQKLNLSTEAAEKLLKEADRLTKMPGSSHEATVIRGYLDSCLELPWNVKTKDKIDIAAAKKVLDKDHYGMQKVKDRILESLAVRSLTPDLKGQIICLVGPPGVGKTSIARSIAKAIGRKYVRLSLGGVRDESDIRGHRKTYIGAMPGRIINAIKLAGSCNPLMLLDEVDKLGNDFRGDPSSALLEVLDSEQNVAFRDHYIEIPFDLSGVLFIATANNTDTIPAPLLDRMEIISLTSYTREEKFSIAKQHLLGKQLKKNGVNSRSVKITDDALYALIDYYTRESGVRNLEREIASLCRKAAKRLVAKEADKVLINAANIADLLGPKRFLIDALLPSDEVGVANGLAWTSVGGEMMQIEVAVLDGTGKLELTGSLGNVMKESAQAAISFIRSNATRYHIDPDFYKTKDIHIHVPEGAVPKDGPSAGITICTAVISALSGFPVKRDLAMTGEMTLRGRVLPIGGLKEKTMAAYRAGVKTVVIPKDNEPDLAELDSVVKEGIKFITATKIDTVLGTALITQDGFLEYISNHIVESAGDKSVLGSVIPQ